MRCPPKLAFIDGIYHHNHSARSSFERDVFGILCPTAEAFRDMAIRAIQTQRGGKEAHRLHELIHRNPFEHLDVLEDLFRHQGLLSCPSLATWLRAQGVPRRHKTMVPTAQWTARLDSNFILPPSLAMREEY